MQQARSVGASGTINATLDGLPFRLPLPCLAGANLQEIDGRRSFASILARLQAHDSTRPRSAPRWRGYSPA